MAQGGIAAALAGAGLFCLVAALAGGVLKGLGRAPRVLQPVRRLALLGGLGLAFLIAAASVQVADLSGAPAPVVEDAAAKARERDTRRALVEAADARVAAAEKALADAGCGGPAAGETPACISARNTLDIARAAAARVRRAAP
ncbi:MAG: hypothetical protein V4574_12425 [Pseudomonadota bacterium]